MASTDAAQLGDAPYEHPMTKPELQVLQDYDGYFQNMVQMYIDEKHKQTSQFKHKQVIVTSGPWRMYDIHFESKDDVLYIDFHSPCRFADGPEEHDQIVNWL